MKTLFLIDGAYQEAKNTLCSILEDHTETPNNWRLITKYSTKLPEGANENDLSGVKENQAKDLLEVYSNKKTIEKRISTRYFCYKYPEIERQQDFIYCIDTEQIDVLIDDDTVKYGFLIVRNPQCINDLIYKYERNGCLNVVPVFLYTDYTYIEATKDSDVRDKWLKLWRTFAGSHRKHDEESDRDKSGEVVYENVLVFNADLSSGDLREARRDLREQLDMLDQKIKGINEDKIVVTEKERTYIPREIRERKGDIEKIIGGPMNYRKNVFVMMKYHDTPAEKDDLYLKIKNAVESMGYNCIRADDAYIQTHFPRNETKNKPSLVYWLATFLCGQGIAIFEKDDKGAIALNPNVAYEMGLMKQQGKHVEIFVPDIPNIEKRNDLFFDVSDCWQNRYKNNEELIEKVKYSLH